MEHTREDAIPIIVKPDFGQMSQREQLEFLASVSENRSGALAPGTALFSRPAPATGGASGEGFTEDDLDEELPGRSESYTMPNGRVVWVHPVSPEEAGWLNRKAAAEVAKMGLLRDDLTGEAAKRQQRDAAMEAQFRAQVWQVVACCRVGPSATSAKVFTEKGAEKLRRNPGYLTAVQEIAALSDRLSGGKSEAALLKEMLVGFFAATGNWLQTWSSRLTTDSLAGCREALSAFGDSACSIAQQGRVEPKFIQAMALVLASSSADHLPEPESQPTTPDLSDPVVN